MEKVDIYNKRHEKSNYVKGRKNLDLGEYRLSCFAWIMNEKNQILVQQRLKTANKFPNMWETVSGGATEGDSSLTGMLRELDEELGIKPNIEDLTFIGSYIRYNDFVEVWFLKSNVSVNELVLQEDEVQDAKWVTIEEYEKMLEQNIAIGTAFDLFKIYYNEFYNKKVTIINGKMVIDKI